MHVRLIAVGDRQPAWVDAAFDTYARRFPRDWKFNLEVIPTAQRAKNERSTRARDTETEHILARTKPEEIVVLLDERGHQLSTRDLARRLQAWQQDGRDLCFVIGGPDGVEAACQSRSDFTWSLSALTLPHGLARVLFAEQMYRTWSLQSGHPYHRE